MEALVQDNLFDNPIWIVLEDLAVYTIVVENSDTASLRKKQLEPLLETHHPGLFERVIEIKDGPIFGQMDEGITANYFHVRVSPQSPLCLSGDGLIQLHTDDLVGESSA